MNSINRDQMDVERTTTIDGAINMFNSLAHVRSARVIVALVVIACICTQGADAQWRIPTPRDTVYVPASNPLWSQGRLHTNPTIQYMLTLSGTFGVFSGQDSTNFDARWCYNIPGWNAPLPMPSPVSWNGTSYNVYFQASADGSQTNSDSLHTLETFYMPSHQYTALYKGGSSIFQFRIYNRLDTKPDGFYYSQAKGGIKALIAQYTPAISIQRTSLTFPKTTVGSTSRLIDSIAGYGLQALNVDSVWIAGPNASYFSVSSQRGNRFSLGNESANQFIVSYSPLTPDALDQATLYIRCSNADPADTLRQISLSGSGAAPNGAISPTTLDFGLVRVGTSPNDDAQSVIVFNSGNAALTIDSITPKSNGVFSTSFVTPSSVNGGNGLQAIPFGFSPTASQTYSATFVISTSDGKKTPIILRGEGAEPVFTILDSVLDFGTVFTGYQETLYDTVRNDGDWSAHVVDVEIIGGQKNSFSRQPVDQSFFLNADSQKVFAVTFNPGYAIDAQHVASLLFYLDDASQPRVIHLIGNEKKPRIHYDANSLNFGKVKVGSVKYSPLGVENLNNYPSGYGNRFVPSGTFYDTTTNQFFPGGSDTMHLAFAPTVPGPASAWMYIQCDGKYDSIYLYGYGATPMPIFDPSPVDFGSVNDVVPNVGSTTLRDTGDYPLIVCGLNIIGEDSSEFMVTSPTVFPDTVHEGGQDRLNIFLNFTTNAHTSRIHHATLQVQYCDGTMDTVPLIAREAGAFINFCTNFLDFGKVRVNRTKKLPAFLCNTDSYSTLTVGKLWTSGGPFISDSATLTVTPKTSKPDSVVFAPGARGYFAGWLHGAGGQFNEDSIMVTGTGVAPLPALSTNTVNCDTVDLGLSSLLKGFSLKNTGDYPAYVRIEKVGDVASEFTVTLENGDTIFDDRMDSVAVSSLSAYSVKFSPKFPKLPDHEALLLFHFDDSTVQTVKLIGYDRSTFLVFREDTIDFGKVRVGTVPSPTQIVHLINTSDRALTASNLTAITSPFSAAYTPPVTVGSYDSATIPVTFTPTAPGSVQTVLGGVSAPFQLGDHDAVVLKGIGAAPVPQLSTDTIDFGLVARGRSVPRSFTLTNAGNWPLITTVGWSGPNVADFTAAIDDTTISEGQGTMYGIVFKASSATQTAPRTAMVIWTLDNGLKDTLFLIARDVPPLKVELGFSHPYFGRPGDKIYTDFNMLTPIPDSLGIKHISGVITFDPTVVDYIGGRAGALVPQPQWVTTIVQSVPGSIHYDISSATNIFNATGTLLNLTFQLHPDLQPGASSPLTAFDTIPGTDEAIAQSAVSSIFLDSTCGTIHLLNGLPIASYIKQNSPNPFGGSAGTTTIPFDVGDDNTIVTIRIIDMSGREALRPVDHAVYDRGHYTLQISASSLNSGAYFYEFEANGTKTQIKKMLVQ